MKIMGQMVLLLFMVATLLLGCATDQASQSSPKKMAQAHEKVGTSLYQAKDYQGALRELLKAAEFEPGNASIQNYIGLCYLNLKEYNSAVLHFKKALQLKPDYPEAQNNLGTAYGNMKQWDAAIQYFEAAANNLLYRTRHIAYDNLGAAYHNK
jgi:type IV pilus assembly protein PilF